VPFDSPVLGQGVYTTAQAARLIGEPREKVSRWTQGRGSIEALWNTAYVENNGASELSFGDLIELRVVRAFRREGMSLQAIRFAIEFAQERFNVERPLTSLRFKTDGQEILAKLSEADEDYFSFSKKRAGQKVFAQVVKQSLKDLEYEDGYAARWRPAGTSHIIIDPVRLFGDPLLEEYGVATSVLYEEAKQFDDISYLSKIYEIPISVVRSAIQFERKLDG